MENQEHSKAWVDYTFYATKSLEKYQKILTNLSNSKLRKFFSLILAGNVAPNLFKLNVIKKIV